MQVASIDSEGRRERRRVVTREGLGVADALLGRRLASPGRRLAALVVDLVLVAALTTLTTSWILASVVGLLILWLVVRSARGWRGWAWRLPTGALAAFVAFLAVLAVTWDGPTYGGSAESWQAFGEAMGSQDPEAQRLALEQIVAEMDPQAAGDEWAETLDALGVAGVVTPSGADGADADDATARLEEQIRELRRRTLELIQENQRLRAELDDPSLLRSVSAVAGDLGLEVGWAGVYFLLLPALWSGRTFGKRLLRLRIVRLDDRPLSIWNAFERLGGYAAGLATGLLGFLQIVWDPNRQGVHDKIVGTVVVVD